LSIKWEDFIEKQKKVNECIKTQNYEEAIKICQDMIKKNELFSWPYSQLMRVYAAQRDWESAVKICEEALKLDESDYPNQPLFRITQHAYKNKFNEYKNKLDHPEKIVTSDQILNKILDKPKKRKQAKMNNKNLNKIYDEYCEKLESSSLKWKMVSSVNLSIKNELGFPLSGRDLLSLSMRKNNQIMKENVDAIISYLEEKIRLFEEEHDIDLLSLITENYAFNLGYNIPFWWLYPLRERVNLTKKDPSIRFRELDARYYDYSRIGEFQIVVREWIREAENFVREAQGLPLIGEGFLNETRLYNIIRDHYEPLGYTVIHHAHPPFLGRQELDVYIPSLKLGIEYQGRQHYDPVEFFGGEEGLRYRQELDAKKRMLCKENNILLIEFKYDETIEENVVLEKIQQYRD